MDGKAPSCRVVLLGHALPILCRNTEKCERCAYAQLSRVVWGLGFKVWDLD